MFWQNEYDAPLNVHLFLAFPKKTACELNGLLLLDVIPIQQLYMKKYVQTILMKMML